MIVIRRAARVAIFRRDALFEVSLDNRATADAALLVSGVAVAGYLWNVLAGRGFSLWFLLSTAINWITVWIILAGLTFLIGKLVCPSETPMSSIMRLQGFCYLPLLLTTLSSVSLFAMGGLIWFLAVLVFATAEALETAYFRAGLAVGGSLIGMWVISQVFWGGRLF